VIAHLLLAVCDGVFVSVTAVTVIRFNEKFKGGG